jgi:hypothetical protein
MRVYLQKSISVFLVTLLSFGVFIVFSPSVKAIKDFSVDVQPQKIGTVGTYKFTFTVEKTFMVHHWIKIVFPPGTVLNPPLPEDEKERRERLDKMLDYIYFGSTPCGPCGTLPIFTMLADGSLEMKTNTVIQYDVEKDPVVVVTIYSQAGIEAPAKPGKYIYKIATQPEPTLVESAPYEFFESKLTNLKVSIAPNGFYQPARIAISFKLGDAGKLKAGSDTITIKFPEGTEFSQPPSTFRYEWIQINGTYLGTKLKDSKNELILPIPLDLASSAPVEIIIDVKAGIINPKKPGMYQLIVSTTADDAVKSAPYEIVRTSPQLILGSNKINRNSSYTIQYAQDIILEASGKISITFPPTVQMPQTKVSQEVLVNDVEVSAINSNDNILVITVHQKINIGEPVVIEFTNSFGLINPEIEGPIKITFKPEGYKENQSTNSVEIIPQYLEISNFSIKDSHSFEKTDYYVTVVFDDNHLPQIGDEFKLDLGTPNHVQTNGKIEAKVEKGTTFLFPLLDIKNPSAGTYTAVFSFAEQTASYDYVILPGKPECTVTISEGLRGKNDWWIQPPTIMIESSDLEAQIFYSWEGEREGQKTPFLPYPGPLKLYLGQYKTRLHYYSKNGYGAEQENLLELMVDSINPEIEILNPKNAKTLTNELKFKVEGKSFQTKMIYFGIDQLIYDPVMINGNEALISEKGGLFSQEVDLIEGDNQILIRSEDEAGNFVEKTFVVTRDSTPPDLTILSPLPETTFTKNPVTITGKTEPSAKVTVNGNEAKVGEDGSFQFEVSLVNVGPSTIYFEATDPLGNVTKKELHLWRGYTINLQIGQTSATVNGVTKIVPLAPFIQKGRTLVPFRFIGEELRAIITFQSDPKTKLVKTVSYELDGTKILLTIGRTVALVSGVEVKLEVPAQIIKGSTVVPLRFVTEGLGCRLNWDPSTQNITIWYPKWNM